MRRELLFILLLTLIISVNETLGQEFSIKSILIQSDTLILVEHTIVPESIEKPDSVNLKVLDDGKTLVISNVKYPFNLYYKTLSFDLQAPYYLRSLDVYDSNAFFKDPPKQVPYTKDAGWLDKRGLQHHGAITRGVTIGSHQSLSMQSRMNLQLEGKLNDDLNVSANITDQRMPYLPEGNSQYLRDFDRVSVRLYNDRFSLEAGDQLWQNNASFFGRYSRNVEGARATFNRITEKSSSSTYIGAAAARGKFSRQQLMVEDGVSGPYRIPRPSASSHVVVLPGSEKIFLDGRELVRGLEQDYTIDYNQGEVTFTNGVLLTAYSRVIIEFEYTQLSYQQSSLIAGHEVEMDDLNFYVRYYRQKDNPQQTLGFDLSMDDLASISKQTAVDNMIFLSGADSTGFNQDGVMYAKNDTLASDGKIYEIYYCSRDPNRAHYRLSFRETTRGNYIVKEYTAEGKVYQWVEPSNGSPQGNYEPEIVLNTPETRQLVSAGGSYKLNDFDDVKIEVNTSTYENNNLSNKSPQSGLAALVAFEGNERPVANTQYKFSHRLEMQWVQHTFEALERYRSVEFERFWLSDTLQNSDLLLSGNLNLRKSSDQIFEYSISRRDRGGQNGWLHDARIRQKYKNLYATGDLKYARSATEELGSRWLNYDVNFFYKAGAWQPGVRAIAENNGIYLQDSLYSTANNFTEKQLYLNRLVDGDGTLNIAYSIREDHLPVDGEFSRQSLAHTVMATIDYEKLSLRANYRKLNYTNQAEDATMLSGDALWSNNIFKIIKQEIGYGLSQGRELSRAFQFIRVIPGEGTHTWRDMNGDDTPDIDEFFEAINIDERNYIKILIPTEDYVSVYESRINYRGEFTTPQSWKNSEGVLHFLSRLRGTVNFQSAQKTSSDSWSDRLLSISREIEDSLLISERSSFHSRLVLQRTAEKLGAAVGYQESTRKQLFQVGYQEVLRQAWTADVQYSLSTSLGLDIRSTVFNEMMLNDYSAAGSYAVSGKALKPELSWTLNPHWRLAGGWGLQYRDALETTSEAVHKEMKVTIKHSRKDTYMTGDLRLITIDFEGKENTAEGYALLEAMRPGKNIYWQLNVQQKISGALRLSVFYDGRKPEDNTTVHMGRVQLTALF